MKIILGGPGCGKTHHLLGIVENELAAGVSPDEIAFVAFTRKAAREARERAAARFGFSEEDMPYFRTLHSLAFRQLALRSDEVMGDADYKAIGESLGLTFGAVDKESGMLLPDSKGDQLAYLEQFARLTMRPLRDVCREFRMQDYWDVNQYHTTLKEYKRARKSYDFTDMLEMFCDRRGSCPRFKVVIVDEAQDLSPLQWRLVHRLVFGAERVYVAGDDDQAIYEWSGADIRTFLTLQGEVSVLPVSHRLPRAIFNTANEISSRIRARYGKEWQPASEGGEVRRYSDASMVNFVEGSWLLLARNRYMLSAFTDLLKLRGLPYVLNSRSSTDNDTVRAIVAWEQLRKGARLSFKECKLLYAKLRTNGIKQDMRALPLAKQDNSFNYDELAAAHGLLISKEEDWMTAVRVPDKEREYYRSIRRHGESMVKWPRLTVSTIHQVKGGEADHVLLRTDMSFACYRNLVRNPDSEARVFYVGATRAKQGLHILFPRTGKFYEL